MRPRAILCLTLLVCIGSGSNCEIMEPVAPMPEEPMEPMPPNPEEPMPPMPVEPRPPVSTNAGLFAASAVDGCDLFVDAEHVGPQGVFDHNNDGFERVTLIAAEIASTLPADIVDAVWLLEDTVIGTGLPLVVVLLVGDYDFTVLAFLSEVSVRSCPLHVSVIPRDTPTAVFDINQGSFSNVCIDYCDLAIKTQQNDPDGVVLLDLDGSASSGGLNREITRFRWSVDGVEVANGPVVTVPLKVGEHEIELLVENDVGLIHRRIISPVIVLDFSQGRCPEC